MRDETESLVKTACPEKYPSKNSQAKGHDHVEEFSYRGQIFTMRHYFNIRPISM